MPDDKKTTQPHANVTKRSETIRQNDELPRESTAHLPTGYQRVHTRPLVPKSILSNLLVRNNIFESTENAGGCGKPISKIVEWRDEGRERSQETPSRTEDTARDWTQHSRLFLQLFADCIPVKGAARSAFYDLTRHEIILFPTDYYLLLEHIMGKRVGDLLERIESAPTKEQVLRFLDFLDEKELIMLVEDPSEFPPIENSWDCPALVQNAIVDVSAVLHDFDKIFNELSALGCQYVQIRSFSNLLTLSTCHSLLEYARDKSIEGIEFILKYENAATDETYVTFMKEHTMVTALTVHAASQPKYVLVDTVAPVIYEGAPSRQIYFTNQRIDSEVHCGIITQRHLTPPAVKTFFETKSFNGCLNRKISVDAGGNIKNCPSMKDSYGNIRDSSLLSAVHASGFKEKWGISKDHISICRDCEFRYACSDCRAYLENPSDAFSKPLKCGYDPYSVTWNEWSENPAKIVTAKLYGMELLIGRPNGSLPAA